MWNKRENSLRGNAKSANYSASNGSAANANKSQEGGEWESVQKRKKKTEKKPKDNYVNGDGRYVTARQQYGLHHEHNLLHLNPNPTDANGNQEDVVVGKALWVALVLVEARRHTEDSPGALEDEARRIEEEEVAVARAAGAQRLTTR